ncbi:hypothetical protein AB4489_26385, partial [Vibrio sp. 10N.222.55.F8]
IYVDNTVEDNVIYLDETHLSNQALAPNINQFKLCNYNEKCIDQVKLGYGEIRKDIISSYNHRRNYINSAIASKNTIKELLINNDEGFLRIRLRFDM